MPQTIQVKRGTSLEWSTQNPVLASGEIGFDSTVGNIKVGNGLLHWQDLNFISNASGVTGSVLSVNSLAGTVVLTKNEVGLSNVSNTNDANKPISTATQTALDNKQTLNSNLTTISGLTPSNDDILQRKSGAWINRTVSQYKTDLILVKGDVGLGSVPNLDTSTTSNITDSTNKRFVTDSQLSTIGSVSYVTTGLTLTGSVTGFGYGTINTQLSNNSVSNSNLVTAPSGTVKANITGSIANPSDVTLTNFKSWLNYTKTDITLSNVDNTSDANKPISTATQTALDLKLTKNSPISAGTNTKITYDLNGLVLSSTGATTSDIVEGSNLYFTNLRAQDSLSTIVGSTSTISLTYAASSLTANILDSSVTYSKFQNINTNKLLGRSTDSTGIVEEISIGTGLSLTAGTLNVLSSSSTPSGTGLLDFGSAPGKDFVTTTVTGITSILSSNLVIANIYPIPTVSNNLDEHLLVPLFTNVSVKNIIPATGFDVVAVSNTRLTGLFTFYWKIL